MLRTSWSHRAIVKFFGLTIALLILNNSPHGSVLYNAALVLAVLFGVVIVTDMNGFIHSIWKETADTHTDMELLKAMMEDLHRRLEAEHEIYNLNRQIDEKLAGRHIDPDFPSGLGPARKQP